MFKTHVDNKTMKLIVVAIIKDSWIGSRFYVIQAFWWGPSHLALYKIYGFILFLAQLLKASSAKKCGLLNFQVFFSVP